jgi:hypothetical protein
VVDSNRLALTADTFVSSVTPLFYLGRPDLDPKRPKDLAFAFPQPARQLLMQQLPQLAAEQQALLQLTAEQGDGSQPQASTSAAASGRDSAGADARDGSSSSSGSSAATFGVGFVGSSAVPGQYRQHQRKGECLRQTCVSGDKLSCSSA